MKKIVLFIIFTVAISSLCFAQSNNIDTTLTSTKTFFRDTLTTAIDTMDIAFEYAERFDAFVIEAISDAVDTLSVYVQLADGSGWSQQALIDLSTGSDVTTLNMATVWRSFQILDPRPNKIRVITASDDDSNCIIIVSGKRQYWK